MKAVRAAWVQHRRRLLLAVVIAACVGALVGFLGWRSWQAHEELSRLEHQRFPQSGPALDALMNAIDLQQRLSTELFLGVVVIVAAFPLILALLLVIPSLSREIRDRSLAFTWTQGISRRHWLVTQFGTLAGVSVVCNALVMVGAFVGIDGYLRMDGWFVHFEETGVVFISYALLSCAAAMLLSLGLRGGIRAGIASILAFGVVRFAIAKWLRPNFLPPITQVSPFGSTPRFPFGSWFLEVSSLDAQGHVASCASAAGCATKVVYQPASRYWPFQGIESIVILALTAGALGLTLWLISRMDVI